MRRAAITMTVDPDGAMHDWIDLPDGWELVRVPSQEAVQLVGVAAYGELLVDVCVRERPDVLLVHPPYDHVGPSVARRIRASGTRLVAYAFDDEIFGAQHDEAARAARARTFDRYVTTREVRWATAPLPPLPEIAPAVDVALVGRAYDRRVALVAALEAAGLRVAARGLGWPEGFVSRREMLELYARAAVVVTTADWESLAVPMVKHRLLDTAMLGAFQVAQAAPDLRGYFPEEEVPSFDDAPSLVAAVRRALDEGEAARRRRARAARARALGEHTWRRRWPELLAGIALSPEPEAVRSSTENRSPLLAQLFAALASRAEASGRAAAAAALFRERIARALDDGGAMAGLGRCLRDEGEREEAVRWLERAATLLVDGERVPASARSTSFALAPHGVGTGLGRHGILPPASEALAYLAATLVELGRPEEAAASLARFTDGQPALARAVARLVELGPDAPPSLQAWRARALTPA